VAVYTKSLRLANFTYIKKQRPLRLLELVPKRSTVGAPRFELGTSCTPCKRASRAAPRPEKDLLCPQNQIQCVCGSGCFASHKRSIAYQFCWRHTFYITSGRLSNPNLSLFASCIVNSKRISFCLKISKDAFAFMPNYWSVGVENQRLPSM
jgi:hypothetical protein